MCVWGMESYDFCHTQVDFNDTCGFFIRLYYLTGRKTAMWTMRPNLSHGTQDFFYCVILFNSSGAEKWDQTIHSNSFF